MNYCQYSDSLGFSHHQYSPVAPTTILLFNSPLLPPAPTKPTWSTPPAWLFHYTDHPGMTSIMEENFIRTFYPAHMKSPTNFGEGVYLTSIPPEAADHIILQNNWNDDGAIPSNLWNGSKVAKLEYCFAIPSGELCPWDLYKINDKLGRDIWIYKRGIGLIGKNFILRQRW